MEHTILLHYVLRVLEVHDVIRPRGGLVNSSPFCLMLASLQTDDLLCCFTAHIKESYPTGNAH